MYCCTWRTPAIREETCRAKKQWKMSVYFTERERREEDKVGRRRERFAMMMPGNKETTVSRRRCRKPGMVASSIADIANHIMNLIGRTISSLTLPDKSSGSCSSQKGESHVGSSLKCDAEMPSLKLDGVVNGEHKFSGHSRYLRMNQIIISICRIEFGKYNVAICADKKPGH